MIMIDTELCDGCGDCVTSCPEDCIGLEFIRGKTTAYVEWCVYTQCGVCQIVAVEYGYTGTQWIATGVHRVRDMILEKI